MTEGYEAGREGYAERPSLLPERNSVESRLLEGDDLEIDALIAFSLYYREKRRWENTFIKLKHRNPTAEEVEVFDMTWSTAKIDELREDANKILKIYSHEVSDRTLKEFKRDSDRLGFNGILSSVLGSFLTLVGFLFFLLVALSTSGRDIIISMQKLFYH